MSVGRALAVAQRAVRGWVSMYTRAITPPVRLARRDEMESDVWEHVHDGLDRGIAEPVIAIAVLERMLRGIPSDLSWRRTHLSAATEAAADGKERPMLEALKRNWWQILAGVFMAWNAFLISAYAGAPDIASGERLRLIVIPTVAVVLLGGGLLLRRRSRVAGDVAIAVGAIPAYVSAFWLVPVILPAAAVAFGALADAAGVRVRHPASAV
jgi:hypothetical protein